MSSRTALVLGLAGLAAITGGIIWFTQIQAPPATVTSTSIAGKPQSSPATVLDQSRELGTPGQEQEPPRTAAAPDAAKQDKLGAPDRKSVERPRTAPAPVVDPAALKPAEQPPAVPEIAPPKLPTLGPIEGGAAAFKSKYAGSSYAERRTRADLLEFALDNSSAPNGDQVDEKVYQALKDELIWLRENMGTPPDEPK